MGLMPSCPAGTLVTARKKTTKVGKFGLILTIAVLILGQGTAFMAGAAPADDGAILKGIVTDAETGEPLIGAAIMVSGTTEGVITDLDGCFVINLLRDNTSFEVSYIGYKTVPFGIAADGGKLSLNAGTEYLSNISFEGNTISITLLPDGEMLENAVVTGKKNLESLQALRNERITSGFAIENMGAKEMSLKGISNAQESVAKLSGISIAGAGQLIVRGLGDRYSTTTLNGLPIASPNPDNKLIPLDIFPAATIQNITVSKVYEASSYADYSGAHVDISTKEGQNEDFFNVSFSTGGYFRTLSNDFYRMDGRSLFLTSRLDPVAENIAYGEFQDYSRSKDIFGTTFRTYRRNPLPDLDGGVGFGRTFGVGGQELSLVASASIKTGDETMTDAFYRTYEASSVGSMQSNYDYNSYAQKIDIAALVDLDYTLRESDNIGLTVFFARNAKDSHLDRHGIDYQESYDLIGSNQVTHIYTLQNYQLSGHHEVERWLIDWGASYTISASDEPDRRQVMYRLGADDQWYFFKLNQQETQRYFGKLGENELVADIKATFRINDENRIRFGASAKDKTRKFRTTRFYYDVRNIDDPVTDFHNPDQYLNFDNIQNGLVSITRSKFDRDQYDAANIIGAAFIEADLKFGDSWYLNAGLRMEASRQSVDYNDDVENLTRNLDAFDFFPAINVKYDVTGNSMLRLSLSRTITRPSFIEMAPFLYQESFGGAQIRGNEDLDNGYNYNFDLKYELFSKKNADMFSVTAYFKYLENPIERTQRLSGGATEHSFQNADNGIAAGVEVEFRKEIVKDLELSANASYMYTNVILPEGGVYTNQQRSLQGASPYLANADISYTPEFRNGSSLSLALLYNLQGPRIHAVGIMGLGDVKQMPLNTLDFVATYNINKHFSVKMAFNNMLDSTVKFKQEIPNAGTTVDVEQWRVGTGFEVGISYSL